LTKNINVNISVASIWGQIPNNESNKSPFLECFVNNLPLESLSNF